MGADSFVISVYLKILVDTFNEIMVFKRERIPHRIVFSKNSIEVRDRKATYDFIVSARKLKVEILDGRKLKATPLFDDGIVLMKVRKDSKRILIGNHDIGVSMDMKSIRDFIFALKKDYQTYGTPLIYLFDS